MHLTHWTISFAFAGREENRKKVQTLAIKFLQENILMVREGGLGEVSNINDVEFYLNKTIAGHGEFDGARGTMWTIGRFSNYSVYTRTLDRLYPFFRLLWEEDILDKRGDRIVMLHEEQNGEGLIVLSLGYDGQTEKAVVGTGWGLR